MCNTEAELNDADRKLNPTESQFCLKNVWLNGAKLLKFDNLRMGNCAREARIEEETIMMSNSWIEMRRSSRHKH
jgi:hypothetical protein